MQRISPGRTTRSHAVMSLGPDGSYIDKVTRFDPSVGVLGATITLRSVRDESARLIGRNRGPGDITATDLSPSSVVWMSTPENELGLDDWTLHAFDRRTGESTILARAPGLSDGSPPPAPPGYTGPVLDGRDVYWAQVGGTSRRPTVDIMSCRVERCEPEVALPGAAFPVVDAGRLAAVQSSEYGSAVAPGRSRVVVVSTAGGSSVSVLAHISADEQPFSGVALDRGVTGWLVRGRARDCAVVVTAAHRGRRRACADRGEHFGYPVASPRGLAWSETSGTRTRGVGGYFVPAAGSVASTLGDRSGLYSIDLSGPYVLYQRRAPGPRGFETVIGRIKNQVRHEQGIRG